jgi:hypothetical protein
MDQLTIKKERRTLLHIWRNINAELRQHGH